MLDGVLADEAEVVRDLPDVFRTDRALLAGVAEQERSVAEVVDHAGRSPGDLEELLERLLLEEPAAGISGLGQPLLHVLDHLVLIEGPRHLFPFARAIISNAVRDGGFPPLLINPIDFGALYVEQHVDSDGSDI